MGRRTITNETGIKRIEGISYHDAWVSYICIKCKTINFVHIGQQLLTPAEAFESGAWKCEHCGFVHSKQSDVPFENWDKEYRNNDTMAVHRFWEGFFRTATENSASYWKQCNVCTRILPFNAFSKHSGWGPLERQMECRSCKGAINAILNPKRTKEQMLESSVRRRIADLFLEGENETINIEELFERFDNKCFKTNILLDIDKRQSWAVDHILPSKYLYPLTKENAALLSKEANSAKRDKWPSEFYTNNELIALAKITGANLELISSSDPVINQNIDVNRGITRYLQVRETSGLAKRIKEIKKIVEVYCLLDKLSPENKKLLGFL
jgi:DNA-directed RNA polymerase subunit RPC12/RpoP